MTPLLGIAETQGILNAWRAHVARHEGCVKGPPEIARLERMLDGTATCEDEFFYCCRFLSHAEHSKYRGRPKATPNARAN